MIKTSSSNKLKQFLLGLFIGLITTGLISYLLLDKIFLDNIINNSDKNIYEKLGNNFKSDNIEIGNFIINISYPNHYHGYEELIYSSNEDYFPIIYVRDKNTLKTIQIFKVSFHSDQNRYILNNPEIILKNIQGNDNKELISIWSVHWGGSDGNKALIAFSLEENTISPIPQIEETNESYFLLTEILSNKNYKFKTIKASDLMMIEDLNNDNSYELLLGSYIWAADEGHYGPHIWNLFVYEITPSEYKPVKWWNNGEIYTTKEKLEYSSENVQKFKKIFNSKK